MSDGVQESGLVAKGAKYGGAHPQRFQAWRWESCLERAYGCTRLERGGDPRAVGWTAVAQNKWFPATMFVFFCSSVGLRWQSRVFVGEAGPRLLSGHALFT